MGVCACYTRTGFKGHGLDGSHRVDNIPFGEDRSSLFVVNLDLIVLVGSWGVFFGLITGARAGKRERASVKGRETVRRQIRGQFLTQSLAVVARIIWLDRPFVGCL
jgi:hypothetical protein